MNEPANELLPDTKLRQSNIISKAKGAAKFAAGSTLPSWWKFWKTLPMAWRYLRSNSVPGNGKLGYIVVSAIVVIYIIAPIDLFPELFIPVFGYVDDIGLIPAFFGITNMFNEWSKSKLEEID